VFWAFPAAAKNIKGKVLLGETGIGGGYFLHPSATSLPFPPSSLKEGKC